MSIYVFEVHGGTENEGTCSLGCGHCPNSITPKEQYSINELQRSYIQQIQQVLHSEKSAHFLNFTGEQQRWYNPHRILADPGTRLTTYHLGEASRYIDNEIGKDFDTAFFKKHSKNQLVFASSSQKGLLDISSNEGLKRQFAQATEVWRKTGSHHQYFTIGSNALSKKSIKTLKSKSGQDHVMQLFTDLMQDEEGQKSWGKKNFTHEVEGSDDDLGAIIYTVQASFRGMLARKASQIIEYRAMAGDRIVNENYLPPEERGMYLRWLANSNMFHLTFYHDTIMIGHDTALRKHDWIFIDYDELGMILQAYQRMNNPPSLQMFICYYMMEKMCIHEPSELVHTAS